MAIQEQELEAPSERFDSLYRRYFPDLVRYCNASLCDRAASEDAAQEVFLRAFRYRTSRDPSRPAWPYLKAIARNVVSERAARASREVPGQVPDTAVMPMDGAELTLAFTGAVESLPARQRMALHLRYILGFGPERAASVLHVSVPAFNQLVFRARERLRAELRRLGHAVPALFLLPIQRLRSSLRRTSPSSTSPTLLRVSSEMLMQVGAGLVAIFLVGSGAGVPRDSREAATWDRPTISTDAYIREAGSAERLGRRRGAERSTSPSTGVEAHGAGHASGKGDGSGGPPTSGGQPAEGSPAGGVISVLTAVAEDPAPKKARPALAINTPVGRPDLPEEVEEAAASLPPLPSTDPPPLPVEPPAKIRPGSGG